MGMISAAAIPIEFKNGEQYQLSPLTDKELDEIDLWLQSRLINIARHSLTPDLSKAERDEILAAALRESSKLSVFSAAGIQALSNIQGLTHLCYISLLRRHPNISRDDIRQLFLELENIDIFNEAFARANAIVSTTTPSKKKKH